MKFRDKILAIRPQLAVIPSGYKRVGDFVLFRSQHRLSGELGTAVMQLFPWCRGVYQYLTTTGTSRNPSITWLAGSRDTVTEHKENGVIYVLDIARIMFAGGNSQLRKRLIQQVDEQEYLVDMFAAVGNLSLQVLYYKKIKATLIEQDSNTYSFLLQTLERNLIAGIDVLNADCRDVQLINIADRIFMGYHELEVSHFQAAVRLAKTTAILHTHPIAPADHYEEAIYKYTEFLNRCEVNVELIAALKVKNYSPGLHHIEIIFKIDK
ncbi:MAG: hypothetical protein INQ03_06935 [Candidatus Heimdallarchaeota archaeon]|nr:hypothetical protein [Candidatus Heimdallarchaeota archaeon]